MSAGEATFALGFLHGACMYFIIFSMAFTPSFFAPTVSVYQVLSTEVAIKYA